MPLFTTVVTCSFSSASAVYALGYRNAAPPVVSVTASSSTGSFYSIQVSLDDPVRTPSSAMIWQALVSSAIAAIGAAQGTVYASSNNYPDGLVLTIPSAAAVRLASSAGVAGTVTFKVLQVEHR